MHDRHDDILKLATMLSTVEKSSPELDARLFCWSRDLLFDFCTKEWLHFRCKETQTFTEVTAMADLPAYTSNIHDLLLLLHAAPATQKLSMDISLDPVDARVQFTGPVGPDLTLKGASHVHRNLRFAVCRALSEWLLLASNKSQAERADLMLAFEAARTADTLETRGDDAGVTLSSEEMDTLCSLLRNVAKRLNDPQGSS